MEIGMLNFWLPLLVTALTKENYFTYNIFKKWIQKQFFLIVETASAMHEFSYKCHYATRLKPVYHFSTALTFWLLAKTSSNNHVEQPF